MLHSGCKGKSVAPRVLKEPACHHPNTAQKQQVPARTETHPGQGGDKCQSQGLAQGKKRDCAAVGGGEEGSGFSRLMTVS